MDNDQFVYESTEFQTEIGFLSQTTWNFFNVEKTLQQRQITIEQFLAEKMVHDLDVYKTWKESDPCQLCGHARKPDNNHGFDQNDAEMQGDKLVHYGRCSYCKICFPRPKAATGS